MGKAQDAPDHLGGGEADRIGEQPRRIVRPHPPQRRLPLRIGEQVGGIQVAPMVILPQPQEDAFELGPNLIDLIQDPGPVTVALRRLGLVSGLRERRLPAWGRTARTVGW